ncbi:aldo/keto reductase [Alteribacter aurantiacus]|uniref:aldo/keto reductase n=1 Tax=Alteribacter aurantiacus TaxID=254410 RepID=UPI00041E4A93|nr:aldo/keto reductase [Alteribacter aurantiacus]
MSDLKQNINKGIGLGTAPLGNMFRNVSDEEALATIQTAWDEGIRYFDTAPFYGFGLSEIRLGEVLSNYERSDFILSSKVGRIILNEEEQKSGLFEHGRKNKMLTDYTRDGTLRSIEDSLKRLKTDHLDMVFVHDISPDFLGDEWTAKFEEAQNGAFPVLDELREEGVIKSWGLGVNTTEPIERLIKLDEVQPDLCLSATQYTLMQHEQALDKMMPLAEKKGMGFVIGSPYNSGALLGGDYFDYGEITEEKKKQVRELTEIADKHDVSLKAAALQYSSAHPAVEAVIPGSTRTSRIKEDLSALEERIPHAFWEELISKGLVSEKAPLPQR